MSVEFEGGGERMCTLHFLHGCGVSQNEDVKIGSSVASSVESRDQRWLLWWSPWMCAAQGSQ